MHSKQDIVKNLEKLGIKKGDKLLVHASYKALGAVDGGIETVIEAFKEAVGEEGTLMFPTFTYENVNGQNPVFNIKTSPSCVGMVPEVFRHGDGVVRSLHPTHSLAVWGKDKEYYVENHHQDQNCLDKNSPIMKLKNNGGKILLVGCGLKKNTLLHGLEIALKVPYAFGVDFSDPKYHRDYICIDENGEEHKREFFHVFARESGWAHNFDKLAEVIPLNPVKLLDAQTYVFDASKLWNDVEQALKENPYCLAEKC